MLPRKTTWVLPQGNHCDNWCAWNTRDQTEMGKDVAYRNQCVDIGRPCSALGGARAQSPADGLIWPRNLVGISTLFGSPVNDPISCGAHSIALHGQESKSQPCLTSEHSFSSLLTRKSGHRCHAATEYILCCAQAGKQVSTPTQLLKITSHLV